MFGEDAPPVLHCYIQSSSVELHHRNTKLKPAHTHTHTHFILILRRQIIVHAVAINIYHL